MIFDVAAWLIVLNIFLSQDEQIWCLNRVIVLSSTYANDFGVKFSIAFCTVHVLCHLLVEILNHTTAVHVPCAAIKIYAKTLLPHFSYICIDRPFSVPMYSLSCWQK